MTTAATQELRLQVSDVSEQRQALINDVHPDSTVGELIQGLLPEMKLPDSDVEGRPLVYQARLEREGRQLHGAERLGDVVETGDRLTLQPQVEAGGPS